MFGNGLDAEAAYLLQRLDDVMDDLSALSLDSLTDEQLLALWGAVEDRVRRFAPVDHAIIAQLESRQIAHTLGMKNLTRLGRQVLRVSAGEAAARVKAAGAMGPRRTFTGEPLEPIYPTVAAGQAAGTVSAPAAKLIVAVIEHLPDAVRAEKDRQIEAFLVEQAAILDVDALRILAQRLIATLDPDGTLKDAKQRDRERDLRVRVRPTGPAALTARPLLSSPNTCAPSWTPWPDPNPRPTGSKTPGPPGNAATTDCCPR